MSYNVVKYLWAGRLSYGAGLRLQKTLSDFHFRKEEKHNCNTLVFLEHYPVYTIGIRDKTYTKQDEEYLKSLGAEFYKTNRGGLITFHGPGQLVAYPILNLKDFKQGVKWYVYQLEQMIINLCAVFDINAHTSPDTGVWVEDRKICAIGIHGSRYITTHGLALNCNTDLEWFEHIVPCGIEGKGVTSISEEVNIKVTTQDVSPLLKRAFEEQFQCMLIDCNEEESSKLLEIAENHELRS